MFSSNGAPRRGGSLTLANYWIAASLCSSWRTGGEKDCRVMALTRHSSWRTMGKRIAASLRSSWRTGGETDCRVMALVRHFSQ